jgi:hypothetical protein
VQATSAGAVTQALGSTGAGSIGRQTNITGTSYFFTGYITNVRIVKGVAVYTGDFTPPKNILDTTQGAGYNVNAITGTQTSLLLKTPNTGNFLTDSSVNNFTLTNNGTVTSVTPTPVPVTSVVTGLINGSLNFNGSSQYLVAPVGSSTFGTGDFTVEGWFYRTSATTNSPLNNATGGADVNYWSLGAYTDGHYQFQIRDNSSQAYVTGSILTSINTWVHVAVTRESGLVRLFVNGVLDSSATITKTITARVTNVGSFQFSSPFTDYYTGYISNVRLVTGVAVYTSNFTVPSGPFTATQSANVNGNPSSAVTSGQTTLLLNTFYGGAVSPTLDGSSYNYTITNNGSATSSPLVPTLSNLTTSVSPAGLVPSLSLTSGASTPTFTNNSWFNNLDFTGSSTTPLAATVLVAGDLTLSSGGTYTQLTVIGAGTGTYTSSGKSLPEFFVNTTGTITLADAMTVSYFGLGNFNLIAGTFDLSSFNLTSVNFISTGTSTRAMTGSGTYSITGNAASGNGFLNVSATGISISGITISMTNVNPKTFAGGGGSYSTLNQGGSGALTISGDNSFADITATTRPSTITFTAGSTQTVTGFTLSGTLGNLVTINSTSSGTRFNLSRASGTTSVGYLNIQDSNATGGASWYAGVTSFNISNNLGWIFTAPPGGGYIGNFFAFF